MTPLNFQLCADRATEQRYSLCKCMRKLCFESAINCSHDMTSSHSPCRKDIFLAAVPSHARSNQLSNWLERGTCGGSIRYTGPRSQTLIPDADSSQIQCPNCGTKKVLRRPLGRRNSFEFSFLHNSIFLASRWPHDSSPMEEEINSPSGHLLRILLILPQVQAKVVVILGLEAIIIRRSPFHLQRSPVLIRGRMVTLASAHSRSRIKTVESDDSATECLQSTKICKFKPGLLY
jgi:hypothetical protein